MRWIIYGVCLFVLVDHKWIFVLHEHESTNSSAVINDKYPKKKRLIRRSTYRLFSQNTLYSIESCRTNCCIFMATPWVIHKISWINFSICKSSLWRGREWLSEWVSARERTPFERILKIPVKMTGKIRSIALASWLTRYVARWADDGVDIMVCVQ